MKTKKLSPRQDDSLKQCQHSEQHARIAALQISFVARQHVCTDLPRYGRVLSAFLYAPRLAYVLMCLETHPRMDLLFFSVVQEPGLLLGARNLHPSPRTKHAVEYAGATGEQP